MKKILAVLMLLSVATDNPVWGDFHREWWGKWPRSSERWYPPTMQCVPSLHFQHVPRGQTRWPACKTLDLFLQLHLNQPDYLHGSCTIGWVCRQPLTGSIIITTADGLRMTVCPPNFDELQSRNDDRSMYDDGGSTDDSFRTYMSSSSLSQNPDNVNSPNENTTPSENNPDTSQTNDNISSRQHGGEGLIDVRLGAH